MYTQNLNMIDLSQSDSNVKKEDPTKNVNVNIPYVDNTNIDLKSFDGSGRGTGGNPPSGSTIPHTAPKTEKKEVDDFWDYFVGLNPEFVLNMLEVVFERLRDENNYQDANVVLGQIERIKKKYNIDTPTTTPHRRF